MNFNERYNDLVNRYNDPLISEKRRAWIKEFAPLEAEAYFWVNDYDPDEIEFDCFIISSYWGDYTFDLHGNFIEYIRPTWLDCD